MEADLAFRGIDLRDLWRPNSGMTIRRLLVLIHALPPDSLTWLTITAAAEKAEKATPDKLRERQEHYQKLARGIA